MCRSFSECNQHNVVITPVFFRFTRPPFGTGCIEHTKTEFKFRQIEIIDHEAICQQECIKAVHRIVGYFYSERDNRTLHFADSLNFRNESREKECHSLCNRKECTEIAFLVDKNMATENHTTYHIRPGHMAIEVPNIAEFDFYLNLVGFVTLLFSISLSLAVSNISLLINFKSNFRLTRLCFCASYFVLLQLNAFALLKTYDLVGEFRRQPLETMYSRGLFEYHDFDLHVCFPLAVVFNYTFERPDDHAAIRALTKQILQNYTLEDMQLHSLPPENLIEKIYYNYRKDRNRFDVSRPSSFAFLNSDYHTTPNVFSKW